MAISCAQQLLEQVETANNLASSNSSFSRAQTTLPKSRQALLAYLQLKTPKWQLIEEKRNAQTIRTSNSSHQRGGTLNFRLLSSEGARKWFGFEMFPSTYESVILPQGLHCKEAVAKNPSCPDRPLWAAWTQAHILSFWLGAFIQLVICASSISLCTSDIFDAWTFTEWCNFLVFCYLCQTFLPISVTLQHNKVAQDRIFHPIRTGVFPECQDWGFL